MGRGGVRQVLLLVIATAGVGLPCLKAGLQKAVGSAKRGLRDERVHGEQEGWYIQRKWHDAYNIRPKYLIIIYILS